MCNNADVPPAAYDRGRGNACLANDIVQHSYHSSEPQLPEPVVVHVPMRRTGGRRGLTKHARRALPP